MSPPPRTARDSCRLDFAGLAKTDPPTSACRRVAARLPVVAALLIAASLAAPAAARASLVDEQRRTAPRRAAAGRYEDMPCRELSAEDFDHVGEYAM